MVRAKMADLEQIFNEKGFVRVQSGYIVNLRHVDRVRYKDVLMNNGARPSTQLGFIMTCAEIMFAALRDIS